MDCLNAPYGARCFLTIEAPNQTYALDDSLNAPYGARCFLTPRRPQLTRLISSLNAPYGARCFLTKREEDGHADRYVLMHLMVRGAF